MAAEHDVSLVGVTKRYGRTTAVAGVTLGVRPGQLLALLGPSGCGKTTTLRVIAGLVQPTEGEVFIRGGAVTDVPVHRRNLGMVFQSYALFPHLSVAENVAFGLRTRRVPRARLAERVAEALALVKLPGLEARYPHQLSGGQQQRVALARALVIQPAVLLLDEPFGALDKKLRESMQIELKLLQRRLGITTVFVTHDQEEALTIADAVAVMRDGVVEQHGPPELIYERPVSRFVADFIGAANFFRGKVTAAGPDRCQVQTDEGPALLVERAAPPPEGARVTVAVRPEKVRLIPAPAGPGPNLAPARVEQIVYRGSVTHYFLRLDGGHALLAVAQNAEGERPGAAVAVGTPVTAAWDARSNLIVRDD